jgi:acetolactate synthase-1/2/3 large subunit
MVPSEQTTVADCLVEELQRLGVECVFGLPGVHNLAIWKALSSSPIRLVGVRHEQAAAYAADGYARASGRLGVALVTTGPGAANTLGATGEAMASSSPVLVVATDIPSGLRREGVYRGVLHETRDQQQMFEPVTKGGWTVAPGDDIRKVVRAAADCALTPNSGPVYLGIPTDLLVRPSREGEPRPAPPRAGPPQWQHGPLERASEMLADARRPLIWAGGGALRAGAGEAIGALAEALAAPVITTYMSRGLLPGDHPYLAPGPVHAPLVGKLWDEADLVVAIGSDLDGLMTQNWLMPQPPQLLSINVDEADANKNYHSDLTLIGDAQEVTTALLARVPARQADGATVARLASLAEDIARFVEGDEPAAARMLGIFARVLPGDAIVVADMCIPGYWLAGFHRVPGPRKLAYPMGWGTLGFAFPASLGAVLADVGPTVCVAGDGGFLFACGELATVAQNNIPITVVIVDDGGYGMLRFDQLQAGDVPFGVDLARPDFVALAEAFGIPARRSEGFGAKFEAQLREAIEARAPRVLLVDAALKPPPTSSPRWYRRSQQ